MIRLVSNKYTFVDKLKLGYNYITTKLLHPKQRLVRQPFVLRGGVMVKWGTELTTGVGCRIEAFIADGDKSKKIKLGNRIQLNDYVHISALKSVEIGDDVLMASHVYISDNSHGSYKGDEDDTSPDIEPAKRPYYVAPVKIGNRVWIGEGAIIMPGVHIGDGAVIGAHSIVNKDVPPETIAVGGPARVVKRWNSVLQRWVRVEL